MTEKILIEMFRTIDYSCKTLFVERKLNIFTWSACKGTDSLFVSFWL